jgi:hypothetical protein
MTVTFDDEWTEATDANIPRVDLVGKAANGSAGFLLMKNTAGLLAPDTVRSLIKEAEDATGGTLTATQTTFTGSTGDVMKAIHAASLRQKDQAMPTVLKADDATQAAEVVLAGDEPLPTADEVASATPETAPGDPDDPTSAAGPPAHHRTAAFGGGGDGPGVPGGCSRRRRRPGRDLDPW